MIPEIEFFKKIYIFQDLNDQEAQLIARLMSPRKYKSGQVVMKEGEPGRSMYVIADGEVEINKALTMKFGDDDFRETEKTLEVLKAEDHAVFGEMALVTEAVRSATVTALTDCTLYHVTRDDFLDLARTHPALGFKVTIRLAQLISHRLKRAGDDIIRLTTALSIALSN